MFIFDKSQTPFVFYSVQHNIALFTIGIFVAAVFIFRHRLSRPTLDRWVRYGFAAVLLLFEAALYVWYFSFDKWSMDTTLPFHLCSITFILSIMLLISSNYAIYEFTYFAGMGGALQALLTPAAILSGFPHFTYYYFFAAHSGIILACLYMTWVHGYRPRFRSIWKTLLILNLYMILIMAVNKLTHGNYLFIAHKPAQPSLIDYLGPWPWYIVSMEVVAFIIFLLLYLPFLPAELRNKR